MMLLSGKADTVADCSPKAPAAPASATATVAATEKTIAARQKLFKCMLSPSVDVVAPAEPARADSPVVARSKIPETAPNHAAMQTWA